MKNHLMTASEPLSGVKCRSHAGLSGSCCLDDTFLLISARVVQPGVFSYEDFDALVFPASQWVLEDRSSGSETIRFNRRAGFKLDQDYF